MLKRVLVLGAYGAFGSRACTRLNGWSSVQLICAGRDKSKAESFASRLNAVRSTTPSSSAALACELDVHQPTLLRAALKHYQPHVVIHTSGPFSYTNLPKPNPSYDVARACIENNANYIDLADDREFVTNFASHLNEEASQRGVMLITGASSVPAVSSTIIDEYKHMFSSLESVEFCISPGNKTPRGLATIQSVLSYAGRPFTSLHNGDPNHLVYGWSDVKVAHFDCLPTPRLVARCSIPDLSLLPKRYPTLRTLDFRAGVEMDTMQLGIFLLASIRRFGLPIDWSRYASQLKSLSDKVYTKGTNEGAMQMILSGKNLKGKPLKVVWELYAGSGDGPQVPASPAVMLTHKMCDPTNSSFDQLDRTKLVPGAYPCLGLFTGADLKRTLSSFDIKLTIRAVEEH